MPIYTYGCSECNHHFELTTKIAERKDAIESPCPSCGEMSINIVLGTPMWIDAHKIGIKKPDSGFREVISKIQERTPGSKLKDFMPW